MVYSTEINKFEHLTKYTFKLCSFKVSPQPKLKPNPSLPFFPTLPHPPKIIIYSLWSYTCYHGGLMSLVSVRKVFVFLCKLVC